MTQDKNKQRLKVHPAPFKSSYLSIPPSPFSPRTPVAFSSFPRGRTKYYPAPDASNPPPQEPLQWVWRCHKCHHNYHLGVTRRCLEDGHFSCAGTTTTKNWRKPIRSRKVKRHRACSSEFDYQSWKTWGTWRRSGRRDSIYDDAHSSSHAAWSSFLNSDTDSACESEPSEEDGAQAPSKDCWNTCDYPSECRWGKSFGVHTPVATEFSSLGVTAQPPPPPPPPPPPTTFEGILKPENCRDIGTKKKAYRADLWGALIASATRRRSVPPSSPLADVPGELESAREPASSSKDTDGNGAANMVDTALTTHQSNAISCPTPPSLVTAAFATSAPVTTLKDLMRKTSNKSAKPSKLDDGDEGGLETSTAASGVSGPMPGCQSQGDLSVEVMRFEIVEGRDGGCSTVSA